MACLERYQLFLETGWIFIWENVLLLLSTEIATIMRKVLGFMIIKLCMTSNYGNKMKYTYKKKAC